MRVRSSLTDLQARKRALQEGFEDEKNRLESALEGLRARFEEDRLLIEQAIADEIDALEANDA